MTRLIIIGSGIAGSCLAREARDQGIETTVVADSIGNSQVALAVLRPSYLPATQRAAMFESLEIYRKWGVDVIDGAIVTTYRDDSVREQNDWWAVDPLSPLIKPDLIGTATALSDTSIRINDETLTGKIVWCDGKGIGRYTYGSTYVHDDPNAVTTDLSVHNVAPYKTVVATRVGSVARIGSSSASTMTKGVAQGEKLLDLAIRLGWLTTLDGWIRIDGERLQRSEFLDRSAPKGAWRWSGFHRSGYSLAPALAKNVLETVFE
jgi:hypothetical protein